jgi:hypothetical protein
MRFWEAVRLYRKPEFFARERLEASKGLFLTGGSCQTTTRMMSFLAVEANAGLMLIPFAAAVLMVSTHRLWRTKRPRDDRKG